MEMIKHDPEEFGGLQTEVLCWEDISNRICASRGCGQPGEVQLQMVVPAAEGPQYRILCSSHIILYMLLFGAIMGDPSAAANAREIADLLGISWQLFLEKQGVAAPIDPEQFRCLRCGGRMQGERVGMLTGTRYIHTCGEPKRSGV